MDEFVGMPKIARLSREVIITEKIDGTNGQIYVEQIVDSPEGDVRQLYAMNDETMIYGSTSGSELWVLRVASKNQYLTKHTDNHGFHKWATTYAKELLELGPGRHFGEWWGKGIQRGYGLAEKRFSFFNTSRWIKNKCECNIPNCCDVVPVLYQGMFDWSCVEQALDHLQIGGSRAAPGYRNPEGVVIYHTHANICFKKTLRNDEAPKSKV